MRRPLANCELAMASTGIRSNNRHQGHCIQYRQAPTLPILTTEMTMVGHCLKMNMATPAQVWKSTDGASLLLLIGLALTILV